jgi:hypothetical protein
LVIIEQEVYDRAQEIAKERLRIHAENRTVPLNTRGQSLLAGNAYCGHCGSKLTLTTNGSGYVRKNGELTMKKRIRYVCYNKTRKRCNCDGQTGYTMTILDDIVEVIIHQLFDRLKKENRIKSDISGNNTDYSINFEPKMQYEKLLSGYKKVVSTIYSPKNYYARVTRYLKKIRNSRNYKRDKINVNSISALFKSIFKLGIAGKERVYFWKLVFSTIVTCPMQLPKAVTFAIYGYHFRKIFKI